MKITRIIALAIIAAGSGAAGIQAQTLRDTSPPAEIPPASFDGKQYVDSRGCIYIRAGIDGNVTWVPRVTRSRKHICGYAPTKLAGAAPQQDVPVQAPAPELITLEASQRPVQTDANTAVPAESSASPATAAAEQLPRTQAAGSAAPRIAAVPSAAASGSADSTRYDDFWAPNTRIVQQHIYQDRRLSNSFAVPEGYRPVWNDGRLNPRRAERTHTPGCGNRVYCYPVRL